MYAEGNNSLRPGSCRRHADHPVFNLTATALCRHLLAKGEMQGPRSVVAAHCSLLACDAASLRISGQHSITSTDINKITYHEISSKSFLWVRICHTDRMTDGRTDMAKLIREYLQLSSQKRQIWKT
jgi:hypothetical protein